jgi:ankyrin repeat protein
MESCRLLHIAVLENKLPAVKVLLQNGANIGLGDDAGMTPLELAVKTRNHHELKQMCTYVFQNVRAYEELLSGGLKSRTVLHEAVSNRKLEVVWLQFFLVLGAEVNAQTVCMRETAPMMACYTRSSNFVWQFVRFD